MSASFSRNEKGSVTVSILLGISLLGIIILSAPTILWTLEFVVRDFSISCPSPWTSVGFSRDGKTVFAHQSHGKTHAWNIQTETKASATFDGELAHAEKVTSPDGKLIAEGSGWCYLDLYADLKVSEASSGKVRHVFKGLEHEVYCVAWSLDGRMLACGDCGHVRVWDVASEKHLAILPKSPTSWATLGPLYLLWFAALSLLTITKKELRHTVFKDVTLIITLLFGVVLAVSLLVGVIIWSMDWMTTGMRQSMEGAAEVLPISATDESGTKRIEVGRFDLPSHGKDIITIETTKPTRIGYSVINRNSDDDELDPSEQAVVISTKDGSRFSASHGPSTLFRPDQGKIRLVVKNLLDKPIEVEVYREDEFEKEQVDSSRGSSNP